MSQRFFSGDKPNHFGRGSSPEGSIDVLFLFLSKCLTATEKIEKNTTRTPEFFNILPWALKTLLINFELFAGTLFVPL